MLVLSIALGVFLGSLPLLAVAWWLLDHLAGRVGAILGLLARECAATTHHRDLEVQDIIAREREPKA